MIVKLDVSQELYDHFDRVKNLAEYALEDEEESAAGKAATMNAVTAILKDLTKMQDSLHTSAKIALLQDAIIEALEEASTELKTKTIEILERKLATL